MAASAGRLVASGPHPRELWQTVCLSILLHGLLVAVVVLMPRFRVGTYVTVPVSYTVNLVSAAPGDRPARPAAAAAVPRPSPPAAPAPPPRPSAPAPARPSPPPAPSAAEELTLPGIRTARKAPAEVEPSLRPPSIAKREAAPPTPAEIRRPPSPAPVAAPATPAAPSVAPVQPVAAAPAAPPAPVVAAPQASVTGSGQGAGVELANGEKGDGGGSALGYYLALVDNKISTNWVPVGTGGARESVVVIRFRVLRSGQVRDVDLETGSGDAGLDAAAMRAIRQSLPLPPFPNLLTEPYLNLRYRFVMERG